jgi:acetyl-CoA carboxylase biotin carboxyl carrier protein
VKDDGGFLTEREVQRIVGLIQALERSSFDACEVEVDGLKLTLGRVTAGGPPPVARPVSPSAPAVAPPRAAAATTALPTGPSPRPLPKPAAGAHPNAMDVVAPLKGIFYGRPEPGAPPFVTVGASVSAITTIGLVEVMKVFNAVAAGHDGKVVEICVEDGNAVEGGQVLIRIAPSGA